MIRLIIMMYACAAMMRMIIMDACMRSARTNAILNPCYSFT